MSVNSEDEYIAKEDEYNKLHEINELDNIIVSKQKEIENLQQQKQQQRLALINNKTKHALPAQPQPHKPAASFLGKFQNMKHLESKLLSEKLNFLKARVYTFNDYQNASVVEDVNEKEKYSGLEIDRRYVDKQLLQENFQDKTVLRIDKLYAVVHPPDFDDPKYVNWVVVGIIVDKEQGTSAKNSRYLKLTLSNFVIDITILLFDRALAKYYKLKQGDLVGVLNPLISPFKTSFSLILSSDDNSIIEIGRLKNYGHCKAVKKNGTACNLPIDLSKTEYCEYHQNLSLKKIYSNRLELAGVKTNNGPKTNSSSIINSNGMVVRNSQETLNIGSIYFSNPHSKKAFFDDEYVNPNRLNNLDSKRKKLDSQKKESVLKQKLSNFKGGESLRQLDEVKKPLGNEELLKAAYNSQQLVELGFDSHESTGDSKSTVEELNRIRKAKKKYLGASKVRKPEKEAKRPGNRVLAKGAESSDSDLEIDFGGKKQAYMEMIGSRKSEERQN